MYFLGGEAVGLGQATSTCLHSGFDQDLLDLACCFKNPEMLISEECRNHMLPSNLLPFPWFLVGLPMIHRCHGFLGGSKSQPIQ